MNFRFFLTLGLISSALTVPLFAGDKQIASTASDAVVEEPYKFSAEFTIEQAYLGGADVRRAARDVNDYDEYYSNVVFVYTPRVKFGILRLGAQWERYSFDFPSTGGQQLPNTLQAVNSIVGFDTKFSDSFLIRIEAQPGFYGTTFGHLDTDSLNVPSLRQAVDSIVGFDTKFSDSFLLRLEAQPGFYGTTFDQLDSDSFNVPFVL